VGWVASNRATMRVGREVGKGRRVCVKRAASGRRCMIELVEGIGGVDVSKKGVYGGVQGGYLGFYMTPCHPSKQKLKKRHRGLIQRGVGCFVYPIYPPLFGVWKMEYSTLRPGPGTGGVKCRHERGAGVGAEVGRVWWGQKSYVEANRKLKALHVHENKSEEHGLSLS